MQATQTTGVTFAVDDVRPATELLPECRTHEALRSMVAGIESCHDYHGMSVKGVHYQPLLAAVYLAFSQHRPLVLTPDAVWLTITQGIAQHMVVHGEELRSRLVCHQGKIELTVTVRDWVAGTPENPWADAFAEWAAQIRDHVGADIHDALTCDFTTSGPTERIASQIVMMDIFERYFHYVLYCICGIPAVTLEGTPGDWQRLKEKVSRLRIFDIDWWLDHLEPICDQFARASQGDVDVEHWQGICKLRSQYGGDIINGWVAKLFPYLLAFIGGPCNRRNPIFETGEGFQTLVAPSGLSSVPFVWRDRRSGQERPMDAIGGLVGVTQDPETLALRPKVGWAVRQADRMEVCLSRLAKEHMTFPGANLTRQNDDGWHSSHWPADLAQFYHRTNGARLFGTGASAKIRIAALEHLDPMEWGEKRNQLVGTYGPHGRIWHRIAWLPEGKWLAINLDLNKHRAPWNSQPDLREKERELGSRFAPICVVSAETQKRHGQNPVVALSFTELLAAMLENGLYWESPDFAGYGDAALFTRLD